MAWCMMSHLLKLLNFSDTKLVSASYTILPGKQYSKKIILYTCIHICTEPLHLLYHWELLFIIYNAKIVLVINGKNISSNRFCQPPWYFMWFCFVLELCCLEIKICKANFNCFFYVSIHVDPVDVFAFHQLCHFYAHMIHVQLVQCFSFEWHWYYYSFTFHGDSINYHNFISEWPIQV